MDLSINNVVNISVSQQGAGLGAFNTSNLGLLTHEAFNSGTFGALGYKLYKEPSEVATDFGSDSITYKMANAVFSQQLNILAAGGYLAVIPTKTSIQTITLDAVPASGVFEIVYGAVPTANIQWDATLADVQAALRLIPGLEKCTVSGSIAGKLLTVNLNTYGPQADFTINGNTLHDSGAIAVGAVVASSQAGESFGDAVTRSSSLVQYFGVIYTQIMTQADRLAFAAIIQPLFKIAGGISNLVADVAPGGALDLLRSGSLSKTRALYYGRGTSLDALIFMASYFGRGLSTVFEGSDTTQDMHLKDLISVQPDSTVSQTVLNQCQVAGVDVYVSIEGVSKIYCSGANKFFDQVYNLLAFVSDLRIAEFNVLATNSTKISQTESGVKTLVSADRLVCEKYVKNGYLAPGKWTNPTTFGSLADLLENVSQRGYYIYSQPISEQSAVDRNARKAPVRQIGIKEGGAVDSASILVNVNA